jgi:hypothetical protein
LTRTASLRKLLAMRKLLRDRDHLVLLLLLAVGVVVYFSMQNADGHRGGLAELDGYYYYVYLRSAQMDGDLELGNEYRQWGNPFKFGRTATGYHRNIFGIGPALLWTPFFLITHLLALLGVKLGFQLSLDGMSRFHQVGTFFGTLLYGWLAVLFCYHIARKVAGKEHALWAALGAALAGPLPYYCLTWASYSHAQAAMATSLLVLLWLRFRGEWTLRRWVLFGAVGGLVVLVRPACAAFLVLPLYEGVRALLRSDEAGLGGLARRAAGPALAAAACLVVFSPQLVVWKIIYGSCWIVPQGEGFMRWGESAWFSTLFSPRNGLLTSAPLMTLALAGLVLDARRRAALLLPLCGVFVAVLLVNGAVYDWWGWGFSARRFTATLPLLTIGLALFLARARAWLAGRPRQAIATVTALVVLGAILFNIQWMRLFAERNLKWYSVRSTEGLYMSVTHSVLDDLYDETGNPLSLPASLAFRLRRGGSLRTYDRLDGSYLLGEAHPDANPSADPYRSATMDLGDLRFRYNLSPSFGNPKTEGEVRYAPLREPRGHVFLPLNRPGDLRMLIGGRALHPGTRLELRFNGHALGSRPLATGSWQRVTLMIPGRLVDRGINRLDLIHHLPAGWDAPGPRCHGEGPARFCAPVDLAVVSGGVTWGRFCEVWVDGTKVSANVTGLNVAVADRRSGRLLGSEAFDVTRYPAHFAELARFLRRFPAGSLVAMGGRGKVGRFYARGGREALALIGATTDLEQIEKAGYAAIGALGGAPGTAMESVAPSGHARVRLGRPPPPWREVAHYRVIMVR